MSEHIIDLDAIKPQERFIKIGDKKINVTIVSFERILDIVDRIDKLSDPDKGTSSQRWILETFSDVTKTILKDADPEITDEWLEDNIDATRMIKLITELVMPILNEMDVDVNAGLPKQKETKKNSS